MTARARLFRGAVIAAAIGVTAAAAAARDDPAAPLGWNAVQQPRPAEVLALSVQAPRPFGHVVGDRVTHRIAVTVAADLRLQQASVPVRRRIGEWLELQEIDLEESRARGGRRYRLTLTYQLFSTPLGVENRTIPAFTLRFERGGESLPLKVPGWTFAQSPVLGGDIAHEGENIVAMRDDAPPPTLPTGRARAATAAGLSLALIGGGWLAWLYRPASRRRRPFARTNRALARLEREPLDAARLRAGYRLLHRSLDETAGRALFAADLAGFCRSNPAFASERPGLEAFFADSHRLFFADGDPDSPRQQWRTLRALARRCRRAEGRAA